MPNETVKGFNIDGTVVKYDYNSLENKLELDNTLSISDAAADAKTVGDAIEEISEKLDLDSLTPDVKQSMLDLFAKCAFKDDNAKTEYDALYAAMYYRYWEITNTLTNCTTSNESQQILKGAAYSATITPSVGYTMDGATVSVFMGGRNVTPSVYSNGVISIPSVTGALVINVSAAQRQAVSISAVYTQSGAVYASDDLDSLKSDLVVTAVFADETSAVLPDEAYTLEGTLTAGTSTITVVYGGATATFDVVVTDKTIVSWEYTDGLPGDNGFTKSQDGTVTETLEDADLKLTVAGGSNKYIQYAYNYVPTHAVYEVHFKTGSTTNYYWVFALKNAIAMRCQVSNSYHGFYICNASDGLIANMTKVAEMANNTDYTIKYVLNNGYCDVYLNGVLIVNQFDVSEITSNNYATTIKFTAAGSQTLTGYLYSINMELEGG